MFTYDWAFLGGGYKIRVSESLNTTKANLGFSGTFNNSIGTSSNPQFEPDSQIWLSPVGPILHNSNNQPSCISL